MITGCALPHVEHELLNTVSGDFYLLEYSLKLPLQEGNYALRALITSPVIENESSIFLDVIEDAVIFQMAQRETARIWWKVYLFPTLKLKRLN